MMSRLFGIRITPFHVPSRNIHTIEHNVKAIVCKCVQAGADSGRPSPPCVRSVGALPWARTTSQPEARAMEGIVHTYFEDLEVGQSGSLGKTISEADILMFAGVSGDTNPAHMDEEYAAGTMFKGRIAHGMLSGAIISALFGTKFPGPGCIYVSQSLRFKAPVRIGDTIRVRAEVTELVPAKKFAVLKTTASVKDKVVADGEATLMVPSRG